MFCAYGGASLYGSGEFPQIEGVGHPPGLGERVLAPLNYPHQIKKPVLGPS